MKKTLATISVVAFLFLLGCASETPDAPKITRPETPEMPEISVTHNWVQDAWLFNKIAYFTPDGELIDATDEILSELQSMPVTQSEDLGDGVTFSAYDSLKPTLVTEDGVIRDDVTMTAGIIDFGEENVLTVLATPDAKAENPVDLDNFIELDLTFLGEDFTPGTAMTFDYAFMQALPGDDPHPATPLELLKHRIADMRINFYGDPDAKDPELLMFTAAMGVAVEGSTRMKVNGKGKISDPAMDGFKKGAWAARKGGAGGVNGYFKKFGEGARSSNELIKCNLSSTCGKPDKPKEPKKPKKCRVFCGKAHGDPHLVTFDGLNYAPQAVGEFLLVDSADLTIQMRAEPASGSRTASIITAVAVAADGEKISIIKKDKERLLFVNEEEILLESVDAEQSFGSLELAYSKGEVRIETSTGALVTAVIAQRDITLYVDPGEQSKESSSSTSEGSSSQSRSAGSQITGMLGNADGKADNDLVTRDGKQVPADIFRTDREAFYKDFVNSWRITEEESLFYYFPEESTEYFTDLSFPSEPLNFTDIPTKDLKGALAVCEAAGIQLQPFLDNCIFDFWVTGDIEFVIAAKSVELHTGIFTGEYLLAADAEEAEQSANADDAENTDDSQNTKDSLNADWPKNFAPEDGESIEKYVARLWSWSAHSRYWEGDKYEHFCPPLKGFNFAYKEQDIWGGGQSTGYTSDSSACVAAVHSGTIKPETGGLVSIEMLAGSSSYPAAAPANGITPLTWDSTWSSGFVFN